MNTNNQNSKSNYNYYIRQICITINYNKPSGYPQIFPTHYPITG